HGTSAGPTSSRKPQSSWLPLLLRDAHPPPWPRYSRPCPRESVPVDHSCAAAVSVFQVVSGVHQELTRERTGPLGRPRLGRSPRIMDVLGMDTLRTAAVALPRLG